MFYKISGKKHPCLYLFFLKPFYFKVSAVMGYGIDELKECISGRDAAFAGSSGVGKSSITNLLIPEADMETSEISRRTADKDVFADDRFMFGFAVVVARDRAATYVCARADLAVAQIAQVACFDAIKSRCFELDKISDVSVFDLAFWA